MPKRLTTEEFIEKARSVHGDKYDYSLVDYKTYKQEVEIICNTCGNHFPQTPDHHITLKNGCPKCGRLINEQSRRLTHEEQVAAITKINPNIEILEKITNNRKKVRCRCKVCNHIWPARPDNIKAGKGCPECAKLKMAQSKTISHEKWVEDIAKVNPNIEILGRIVDGCTPVLCRCKICNHKWEPTPYKLKDKRGCPKCADHGFLTHEQGSLYIMVDDVEVPTLMKVGVSVDAEKRRSNVLRSAKKAGAVFSDLHVIKTWEGPTENMHSLEKAMHQALSQYKINFTEKFDGCQEFFYYRPEVFELVEEHLKTFSKQ